MHKRLFYSTCTHMHTHTHSKYRHAYTNVAMVLLFEIDDNFSNVKVRMTTNNARCSVVVEHFASGQTSTTGVEVCATLAWIRRTRDGRVHVETPTCIRHNDCVSFDMVPERVRWMSLCELQEWIALATFERREVAVLHVAR